MSTLRTIVVYTAVLIAVSCSPKIALMKPVSSATEFSAPPTKSLLVCYTRVPHVPGWNDKEYYVFIDGKLVGQMKQDSYFATEVDPGEQYVFLKFRKTGFYGAIMGLSKPKAVQSVAKLLFEPGKTYYLCSQYGGGLYFVPKSIEDSKKEMQEHKYSNYALIDKVENLDMSSEEIEQAKAYYAKKEQTEPESVKDFADYKGY
jgi:hypothetical protein